MPSITVHGMTCNHCKESVTKTVMNIPGATEVTVDLTAKTLSWKDADASAPVSVEDVKAAVKGIGFDPA